MRKFFGQRIDGVFQQRARMGGFDELIRGRRVGCRGFFRDQRFVADFVQRDRLAVHAPPDHQALH